MKRARVHILIFLLLMVLSGCAQTSLGKAAPSNDAPVLDLILQKGELVVGTAGSMPPFNMTAKSGAIIGLDADIARYLAAGMGVKLRLEAMPYADLLPALAAGKLDMVIAGMTITPERNLKFAFVGPYFVSGKAFLTKSDKIASAEDVAELNTPAVTLAALKGSTSQYYAEEAIPKARLIKTGNYDEAVDLVLQNKADALIGDYPICLISVLRHPRQGLLPVLTLLTYEPLGIAMPRNDPHLVNWVENYLENMEESGTLDELKARWFDDGAWLKSLP